MPSPPFDSIDSKSNGRRADNIQRGGFYYNLKALLCITYRYLIYARMWNIL